ncbi:hypothetical protein PENTCL1PPCAC_10373, partial [Pristionchus entomophagus]
LWQMTYVRRDSLETPFGMTPASYHRDDDRLLHEYEPYVRFACGKTQFDVSFGLLESAETITRLFEDLHIAGFVEDDDDDEDQEEKQEKAAADDVSDEEEKDEQASDITEDKEEKAAAEEPEVEEEEEQEPRAKPVVLNEEPIELPFDADIFHILLRCQNDPGLEDAFLYQTSFETRTTLLQLADYLNMADRIEFFARSMSEMLEFKNPEEIADIVGIKMDYTPREIARMRSPLFPLERPQLQPHRPVRRMDFP